MSIPEIGKAESLEDILQVFRQDPLSENELSRFYYDQTMATRTGDPCISPMDDLFEVCTSPKTRNAHLLLGHRSCGKSMELHHLKQRIEKTGQPVYMIDFEWEMNIFQAGCWDIMLAITEGLCRIADQKRIKLDKRILKLISDYLTGIREETDGSKTSYHSSLTGGAGCRGEKPTTNKGYS